LEKAGTASTDGVRSAALGRRNAEGGGQHASGNGADQRDRLGAALDVGLQGVDAQVDRRAFGQRLHLDRVVSAESADQTLFQPVGIVARHRGRCGVQRDRTGQALALGVGQRAEAMLFRSGFRDALGRPLPVLGQHAQHHAARAVVAHHPAQRALAAQGVQN
jgi:hypothetical protein